MINSNDFFTSVFAWIVSNVREAVGEHYPTYKLYTHEQSAETEASLRALVRQLEREAPQRLSIDMYFALDLLRERLERGPLEALTKLARALACAPYAMQDSYARALVRGWVYSGGAIEELRVIGLDARIVSLLESGEMFLCVESYYLGERGRCRSACALAVAPHKGLEGLFGPLMGGAMVYVASYPDLPLPDFFAGYEAQMEDLRNRAASADKAEPVI